MEKAAGDDAEKTASRPWSHTMQKVAAYLLERRDGLNDSHARDVETARLTAEVTNWLSSKGGNAANPAGRYSPEDGSTGTFKIEQAVDGERSWWMLRLEEVQRSGWQFSTSISITSVADRIS